MDKVTGWAVEDYKLPKRVEFFTSICLFVICFLFAYYFRTQDYGFWAAIGWAALYVYGSWIGFFISLLAVVMILRLPPIFKYMPLWFQKPFYLTWKKEIKGILKTTDPLLAFPLSIYIDFKLDEEFLAGGFFKAVESIQIETQRLVPRLITMVTKLAAQKRAGLQVEN